MRSTVIYIILFLSLPLNSAAQSYSIRAYTPSDGLNQSQVEEIFQDSRGYIWIGTRNGVSLFDGRDFINFYQRDGLVDPYIVRVLENREGQIIVVNKFGFSSLGEDGFVPNKLFDETSDRFIYQAEMDNKGRLWLMVTLNSSQNQIYCYSDDSLKNLTDIINPPHGIKDGSMAYDEDNDRLVILSKTGEIWIYGNDTLTRAGSLKARNIQGKPGGSIIITDTNHNKFILQDDQLLPVKPGKGHELPRPLAFFNQDSIFCFPDEEHTIKMRWDYKHVKKVLIDRDKAVWIASEEGLFHLLSHEFMNFTGKTGIESNIWSVVEDREHNIWFASLNGSLQRWDGESIENIESFKEVNSSAFFTGSISLPDGRILFTQSTGVTQYSDGSFSALPYANDQCEKIYYSDIDSSLFIALVNKGLVIKKGDDLKTIESFTAWEDGWVTDIAYDPEGFYWLVTSKTIARLYDDSLYVYPIEKSPINNGYVVEVDSLGNAWFGGLEGLFMYNSSEDRFINAAIEGPLIAVNGMALMDNNRILAGRMNDIIIIDIEKFKEGYDDYYKRYDASSGFLGYEVQQDGIMRDHEGNYWINCVDRVVKFMPDTSPVAVPPPLLNLFSIEITGNSSEWQQLYTFEQIINSSHDPLVLGPGKYSVLLDYRAVCGAAPAKTMYSFRVPGLYDDWTKPDPESELILTRLKPGSYIIEARAAGKKSSWSEPLSLKLIVKPAFWQTTLFKIFMVTMILLAGVLAGMWLTRVRNENKKKKARAIKDYYRLQMGKFVQQFDPHFTFNVISSLVSFIELGDKDRANKYIFKFSELLRIVLRDNSFVRPLSDEIDFISGYCELQKIQMEEKLQFNTDIRSPETLSVNIPRMMVHNFVENAIKWGLKTSARGGRVDLIIDHKDDYHIITVEDNGIGRAAAQKKKITGHGIGLDVSMQLINMLNKINRKNMQLIIEDLYDNDGKAAGTRVTLKIPPRFNMLEDE